MIKNVATATFIMLLIIVLLVWRSIEFLAPYKELILPQLGYPMLYYVGVLAVNLFALNLLASRAWLQKRPGAKLSHIEKELRDGGIMDKLSGRLAEE